MSRGETAACLVKMSNLCMLVRQPDSSQKNGKTYDWSNVVEYDENTRFFSMFNVGYVGRVEILREILPGTEAYVRHMRPVTEIRVDR